MTVELCNLADLKNAIPKVFRVEGRVVAVVRIADEVFAVDAFCPHWRGPLGSGKVNVERLEITCPWHLFRFSLRDGKCAAANNRPPVETFPVSVSNGLVSVDLAPRAVAKSA